MRPCLIRLTGRQRMSQEREGGRCSASWSENRQYVVNSKSLTSFESTMNLGTEPCEVMGSGPCATVPSVQLRSVVK